MFKVSLFRLSAILPVLWAATPALAASEGGGLKLISFTTLLGEIITFVILIWVVMKYVWPPLMNAVETRQKEIADGLADAEEGRQSLAAASERKEELLKESRERVGVLVAEGEQRKSAIVNAAKNRGRNRARSHFRAGTARCQRRTRRHATRDGTAPRRFGYRRCDADITAGS